MGFHVCEYCPREPSEGNCFKNTSSGDVNLTFENGHKWVMPDMILHYVADHGWSPPADFVEDVMSGVLVDFEREQTRSINFGRIYDGERIGYLSGPFEKGMVPEDFVDKLEVLMHIVGSIGNRAQTKGVVMWRCFYE